MWRTLELLEAHIGKTITARFPGTCPVCGQAVKKGDKISVIDRTWMHQQCAKDVASGEKGLPAKGHGSQASGAGSRFGQRYSRSKTASSTKKATPKQVRYAMSLIRKLGKWGWHDSDYGQSGGPPPTQAELKTWSARDISDLIDSLRGEF